MRVPRSVKALIICLEAEWYNYQTIDRRDATDASFSDSTDGCRCNRFKSKRFTDHHEQSSISNQIKTNHSFCCPIRQVHSIFSRSLCKMPLALRRLSLWSAIGHLILIHQSSIFRKHSMAHCCTIQRFLHRSLYQHLSLDGCSFEVDRGFSQYRSSFLLRPTPTISRLWARVR